MNEARSLTRRVDPAARGRRHDRDASLPGHYVPSASSCCTTAGDRPEGALSKRGAPARDSARCRGEAENQEAKAVCPQDAAAFHEDVGILAGESDRQFRETGPARVPGGA